MQDLYLYLSLSLKQKEIKKLLELINQDNIFDGSVLNKVLENNPYRFHIFIEKNQKILNSFLLMQNKKV